MEKIMKYKKSGANALYGVFTFIRLTIFSFITLISFVFISLISFIFMGLMLLMACLQKIESNNAVKERPQQTVQPKLLELKEDKP